MARGCNESESGTLLPGLWNMLVVATRRSEVHMSKNAELGVAAGEQHSAESVDGLIKH